MKLIAKAIILTSVATLLSACQLSTAPKNATYWAKEGTVYQTHQARIIGHDAEIACRHADAAKDLDKAAKKAFFDGCMKADGYVEINNPYPIKQTRVKADEPVKAMKLVHAQKIAQ